MQSTKNQLVGFGFVMCFVEELRENCQFLLFIIRIHQVSLDVVKLLVVSVQVKGQGHILNIKIIYIPVLISFFLFNSHPFEGWVSQVKGRDLLHGFSADLFPVDAGADRFVLVVLFPEKRQIG